MLNEHQIKYIKKNHNKLLPRHIAALLGLHLETVRKFMRDNELPTLHSLKVKAGKLTPEQMAYIKVHHKKKSPTQLAAILEVERYKIYNYLYAEKLVQPKEQDRRFKNIDPVQQKIERVQDKYSNTQWHLL